jgi:hypothetical protein
MSAVAGSAPLVQAHDLAKTFDVSPPWLNRVIEGKPRLLLNASPAAARAPSPSCWWACTGRPAAA